MSKGGRRVLWVFGGAVCFAGLLFVATLPRQPRFSRSVKMLAGLRPVRDEAELLDSYAIVSSSVTPIQSKRHVEVYDLAGSFQEIHDKAKAELKPRSYVASSSNPPGARITIFGIHDKVANRNVVVTLRELSKTKTSLTIAEPLEPGVLDKVVAWFKGIGKPKPTGPTFVRLAGGGSGVIYWASPSGKVGQVHLAQPAKKSK